MKLSKDVGGPEGAAVSVSGEWAILMKLREAQAPGLLVPRFSLWGMGYTDETV